MKHHLEWPCRDPALQRYKMAPEKYSCFSTACLEHYPFQTNSAISC